MKIFSWIQSKRNGKEISSKKPPNQLSISDHMMYQSCKEEFADWPNGLLAIGTFGNSNLKDSDKSNFQDKAVPEDRECTEVDEKELRLLLNQCGSNISGESEGTLVQKFIQEFMDNETKNGESKSDDLDLSEEKEMLRLEKNTSVAHRSGNNDIRTDKRRNEISKRSLKFLLKKAFVCRGGFVPTNPVLRDPFPDPRLSKSRFEKILRAMLHKKIYPHKTGSGSTKTGSYKKCLDMPESDNCEQELKDADRQNKWVKTDSEYIVLEI